MTMPDDKSLKAIVNRIMGNLTRAFAMQENPAPPARRIRPVRPHENKFTEFRLDENFGWPTVQSRNDIHTNISGAGQILREEAIYKSFTPLGDMTARLMIMREGVAIDLRRNETWLKSQQIQIPFEHFRRDNIQALQAESGRLLDELEDNGFFFKNRDRALHALDYVLSTWINEVSEPKIECKASPEPRSLS